MTFEYDINKSNSNKQKHKIDFEESKELFYDDNAIIYPTSYIKEKRYFATGKIKDLFWTAIITIRNDNIRIISTRRARPKEIEHYERQKNGNNNS